MWRQKTISLPAFNRGCHLVTPHVVKQVEGDLAAFKCGLAHIFSECPSVQHTSASLTINENCDRDVRHDMETYLSSHVPEGPKAPWRHTDEGYDDMPAHVKASLFGSSVTIPITDGRLNLGTWQGIWLVFDGYCGVKLRILFARHSHAMARAAPAALALPAPAFHGARSAVHLAPLKTQFCLAPTAFSSVTPGAAAPASPAPHIRSTFAFLNTPSLSPFLYSSSSSSSSFLSSSARPFASNGRSELAATRSHRARPRIGSSDQNAAADSAARGGAARGLFGGLFGGGKEKKRKEESMAVHADVPVPFSADLLAGTFLEGRELACCYRATQDGFSASAFHARCDFKGPVVVVALAPSPSPSASSSAPLGSWLRFGAFNPDGYRSTDDYFDSFDAFLFYWPDPPASPPFAPVSTAETDDTNAPASSSPLRCTWGQGEWGMPELLRKVGGSGAAVFDYARGGPQFGADGLLIGPPLTPVMGGLAGPDSNSGVGDLRTARSRLGLSYEKRRDGEDSVFGEGREVKVAEVLVFFSPDIARLY
ncbi:unnamed protein product [Closterium sp. Yama58-4]|nr:unnamed protein product [Closterium sp. Yama58-4]